MTGAVWYGLTSPGRFGGRVVARDATERNTLAEIGAALRIIYENRAEFAGGIEA